MCAAKVRKVPDQVKKRSAPRLQPRCPRRPVAGPGRERNRERFARLCSSNLATARFEAVRIVDMPSGGRKESTTWAKPYHRKLDVMPVPGSSFPCVRRSGGLRQRRWRPFAVPHQRPPARSDRGRPLQGACAGLIAHVENARFGLSRPHCFSAALGAERKCGRVRFPSGLGHSSGIRMARA